MTRKDTKTRESEAVNTDEMPVDWAEFLPTDDEVRSRAHAIYQSRCATGSAGDEVADWIAAERELKGRGNGDQETARYDVESSEVRQRWRPADHPVQRHDQL